MERRSNYCIKGPGALQDGLSVVDTLAREMAKVEPDLVPTGRWRGWKSDVVMKCIAKALPDVYAELGEQGIAYLADVDAEVVAALAALN